MGIKSSAEIKKRVARASILSALGMLPALSAYPCAPANFSAPHAQVTVVPGCFASAATRSKVRYRVFFPAGYTGKDRLPYAIFLHGRGGSEKQFEEIGGLAKFRAMKGRPFLVIAVGEPRHAYWKNGPRGEFGSLDLVSRDLPRHIESLIPGGRRTIKERAIFGISMGGHGSIFAWQSRPGVFGQVYAISPVFRGPNELDPSDLPAFGQGDSYSRQDPVTLAQRMKAATRRYFLGKRFDIEIGKDDSFLVSDSGPSHTARFIDLLQEDYGEQKVSDTRPGGHDPGYWSSAIERALRFLSDGFPK